MIKSSSEPALRAGFQSGVFQNFSRGEVSKIFDSRGVLGILPFSHSWLQFNDFNDNGFTQTTRESLNIM